MKQCRKRYAWKTPKDGRKYIEQRPPALSFGHFELDFVVSKQSTWSFLVAVDRQSKVFSMHEKKKNLQDSPIFLNESI
jgi:IS30 family transposase